MNKERILLLAHMIEKSIAPVAQPDLHFNMGAFCSPVAGYLWDDPEADYIPECGTIGCIAGWACLAFGETSHNPHHPGIGSVWAGSLLDLGVGEAHRLFYPPDDVKYEEVTPTQAAIVLRHLVETGEVDWEGVLDLVTE
jgi:hypothetical protein